MTARSLRAAVRGSRYLPRMSRGPTALGVVALAIAVGVGGARVGADSAAGEPEPPRPWLGISYDARPSQGIYGLPVTNVFEESGALASGLRVGDEIVEIDGTPTTPGTSRSAASMASVSTSAR